MNTYLSSSLPAAMPSHHPMPYGLSPSCLGDLIAETSPPPAHLPTISHDPCGQASLTQAPAQGGHVGDGFPRANKSEGEGGSQSAAEGTQVAHAVVKIGPMPVEKAAIMQGNSFSSVPRTNNNEGAGLLQDVLRQAEPMLAEASNNGDHKGGMNQAAPMPMDSSTMCALCRKQPGVELPRAVSPDNLLPSSRRKLQWEFKGLTLWLELEEFDNDLTRAVEELSRQHSSPFIPKPHTTAIYGMKHLTVDEARALLHRVPELLAKEGRGGCWPAFDKPKGVTSSISQVGRPGQVCSIAWSELGFETSPEHEDAMDALYGLFYGPDWEGHVRRDRPWTPHNAIAYDNPETNTLSLLDTVMYVSRNPTLLQNGRRVKAMSLWSTEGKMEDWAVIDRVRFW